MFSSKKKQEGYNVVTTSDDDDYDGINNNNTMTNTSDMEGDRYEEFLNSAQTRDTEEDYEEGEIRGIEEESNTRRERVFMHPFFPEDNSFVICDSKLFDGVEAIRFLKFVIITFLGILSTYYFVRWMDMENDQSYTIHDMILYDSDLILFDTAVFFFVGRLYRQRGVDHLSWIFVALFATIYSSSINYFKFLQHSATLYQMHCVWPIELWIYVIVIITVCATLILKHIQYMIVNKLFFIKLIEMSLCVALFLLPKLSSPYFHFHHWYAGWIIGMHCNFDTYWSRMTMAWCWGLYMNGIAVYGRDPVLTCGYSYYLSESLHCPYLKCYIEAIADKNQTHIKPMIPQDWWNCSASDGYVP